MAGYSIIDGKYYADDSKAPTWNDIPKDSLLSQFADASGLRESFNDDIGVNTVKSYQNLISALESGVFGEDLSNYIKTSLATTSMLNSENQIFNAQQARLARNFSASEAEKARDWQEYMSSTAYQRGVADMKKAGINPIYAFSQGGASTPVGATAQSSQASVNNVGADNYSDIVKLVADFASSSGNLLASIGSFIGAIKK